MTEVDVFSPEAVGSLAGLFAERLRRSPQRIAYRHYDEAAGRWRDTDWATMGREAGRWQRAMRAAGLRPGDRVAVMLRNRREWVLFDQAALGLGLVTVPLYVEDRAENAAYILEQTEARLLLVENETQWRELVARPLPALERIVCLAPPVGAPRDPRLIGLQDWLFGHEGAFENHVDDPDRLATIVYTSGTTGRPKGVMLSHRNILADVEACLRSVPLHPDEVFLSFLPLSHMLERTVGYYLPVMGGFTVAFARAVSLLAEDLLAVRPTALVSVPRVYERFYARLQAHLEEAGVLRRALLRLARVAGRGRFERENGLGSGGWRAWLWPLIGRRVADKVLARLGGRLRFAVCGGAALPADVERFFLDLGLGLLCGYGLTEASPVVSVNRPGRVRPGSIGEPLEGVDVRIAEDGELQVRGPTVMQGYWRDEAATAAAFTADGGLRSGDLARAEPDGHLYIVGRRKEILVLSNGEKVPPVDMEMAITMDPLFEQAMVVGEGRPALTAVVQLNAEVWRVVARDLGVDPDDPEVFRRADVRRRLLARMSGLLTAFPGYAQLRNAHFTLEPWTVANGLLTPTLKLKRKALMERYAEAIEALYQERL